MRDGNIMETKPTIAPVAAWAVGIAIGMLLGAGGLRAAQQARAYQGTPDDFMQISQLLSAYSFAIDNKDGVAFAATFAADGEFQDPALCVKGREGLIDIVGRNPTLGHDLVSYHAPNLGPIVYEDRDHASVRSTLATYRQKGAGKPDGGVGVTGVYADRLVRVGGRWLFAHRTVHRLNAGPSIPCSLTP
jgi:hypothetical protein